jgi:PAS domain S-box-containing protein
MFKKISLILALQLVYISMMVLYPTLFLQTIFMFPILIVVVIGYVFDYKYGLWATVLGLASAVLMDVTGVLMIESALRFVSYLLITGFINYTQFLTFRIKEKEIDIKRFEEQLSYINSSIDDVIVTATEDTKIRYVSKSVEKMFGYGEKELIGKEIYEIFSPKMQEIYRSNFENYKVTKQKKVDWAGSETVCQRKDGTFFPVEMKIWEFNQDGNNYYTVILNDISERKEYEHRLNAQKNRLQVMSDSVNDALITIDANSEITFCNPSVNDLFGWVPVELLGQQLTVIIPERLREHHNRGFRRYLDTGKKNLNWKSVESVGLRKDGTEFPIDISFGEWADNGDRFFSAVIRDISERKKYERELKDSEERYRAFIKNSTEGIWRMELYKPCSVDMDVEEQVEWFYKHGYFAECNDAMAKMYGYEKADEIIGKNLEFVMPKLVTAKMFLIAFISEGYILHDIESTEKNAKGELIYFSNSMVGMVEDGFLLRGWGVQRDITMAKRYMMEKEKILEEMQKAKDAAEIANKEKDKFLANLSHELRTPLVAVLGYSNIYNENNSVQEFVKAMSIINKNAKSQLDMIEDLLDVSKVMASKIILDKENFNINRVVKDCIESIKPRADEKKIELTSKSDDFEVHADPKRIAQIINNLLSNAVRFTETGKVEIDVWKDPSNFYIKVMDTGIGMSSENMQAIWKPFVQMEDFRVKKHAGVGLGLSIVKNLVELHYGTVKVHSEIGKGSAFTVTIPTNAEKLNLFGIRILLAEDSLDNGELMEAYLKINGATVTWVTDAKQVYETLKTKQFDIYLFDIAMPDEDGITLAGNLIKNGDHTPKVAVSAYTTYRDRALEAGFDMFVEKPIDWDRFLTIKNLVKSID